MPQSLAPSSPSRAPRSAGKPLPVRPQRIRLSRGERERMILAEATRFFAEFGFEGQTRALAHRLGVTQPLLYRYFPDKDSLIARVCDDAAAELASATAWRATLDTPGRPIEERLASGMMSLLDGALTTERVRLLLFAGLRDRATARRLITSLRQTLRPPLLAALRREQGGDAEAPPRAEEIELIDGLLAAALLAGLGGWAGLPDTEPRLDRRIGILVRGWLPGLLAAAGPGKG